MRLHRIDRRSFRLTIGLVLTNCAVVTLLLPGCVRSPREFFSGLRGNASHADRIATGSERQSTAGDDSEPIFQTGQSLLRSETKTTVHPGSSRRPAAGSEVAQKEPRGENLLDKILRNRRQEQQQKVLAGSPWAESPSAAAEGIQKSLAHSESAHTPPVAARNAEGSEKAVNRFSQGFDARLAHLRAELNSGSVATNANAAPPRDPSERPFWEKPQQTGTSEAPQTASEIVDSSGANPSWDEIAAAKPPARTAGTDAEHRVQALLREARDDWDSSNLQDAYRKVLAAQELESLNGIPFDAGDPQLGELAEMIAAEIQRTSASAESGERLRARADRLRDSPEAVASSGGSASADWVDVVRTSAAGSAADSVEQAAAFATEPMISSGGVRLLPPVEASFPTDSEDDIDREQPAASLDGDLTTNVFARFDRPRQIPDMDSIKAWDDSDHHRPLQLPSGSEKLRPFPLLSADESSETLSSPAANRSHVPDSDSEAWPTFSNPTAQREDHDPVLVTTAPPLQPKGETAISPNNEPRTSGQSHRAAENDGVAPSRWVSQTPWVVGGLVLLIIAMRLASSRPAEA